MIIMTHTPVFLLIYFEKYSLDANPYPNPNPNPNPNPKP